MAKKIDGPVPGMTWDEFLKALNGGTGNAVGGTTADINGLGSVWSQLEGGNFTNGEGSGFGTPTTGASYYQDVGDGTRNVFSRGDDGSVKSQNITQNNDSWWDSTGLPLVASLAVGGVIGAAGGFGAAAQGALGGSGVGAGAGLEGAGGTLSALGAGGGAGAADVAGLTALDAAAYGSAGEGFLASGGGGLVDLGVGPTIGGSSAGLGGGSLYSGLGPLAAGTGVAGTALSAGATQGVNAPSSNPLGNANTLKSAGGLLSSLIGGGGTAGAGGALTNPSLLNGLLQTLGGGLSANEAKSLGNEIVHTVDPFHDSRGQYAQQMNNLLATPGYANQFSPDAQRAYSASHDPNWQVDPLKALGQQNAPEQTALNGIGAQYNSLLKDPNAIFQDKAYQAQTAQGQQAVSRALAARGQTASGNEMQALQDYGTANSAQYYNNRLAQLGTGYNQNLAGLTNQYGQAANTANTALSANQIGYNQQANNFNAQLNGNNAQYSQLAQLSGLSQANLGAAGNALAQTYNNVGSAYGQAGQGIGQMLASGGLGGVLSQLGNAGTSIANWFQPTSGPADNGYQDFINNYLPYNYG